MKFRLTAIIVLALLATGVGLYLAQRGSKPVQKTQQTGVPSLTPKKGGKLRIITLAPSLTEIVCAMGEERCLVGVTDVCDYPASVKSLPKVGSMVEPSLEKIIELEPDLVLATKTSGNRIETAEAMAKAEIRYYAISDSSIAELMQAYTDIGAILDKKETAQRLSAELLNAVGKVESISPRLKGKRALWLVAREPLFPAGSGTLYDEIIRRSGMINAAEWSGWREYSIEALLANPPDIIIDVSGGAPGALLKKIPALAGKTRIIEPTEVEFSRPGPRFADALSVLAVLLFPVDK